MMDANELDRLIAGINPFKDIPALFFELFKTQYFVQCILDGKGPYDQKAILDNACTFAMQEVRKRYPKLECQLTRKDKQEEEKKDG